MLQQPPKVGSEADAVGLLQRCAHAVGAEQRERYTATQKLQLIDEHRGALALGLPPKTETFAVGTTVPYTTLYKWTQPALFARLQKQANQEYHCNLKAYN